MGRKPKDEASSKKRKAPQSEPGASETPCTCVDRMKNIAINNFRGLIGTIVPIIITIVFWKPKDQAVCVKLVWFWMLWLFLFQPVYVPTVSMIPIFGLPMFGLLNSNDLCKNFFNAGIALFILGGWVSMGMICSKNHIRCIAKLMSSKELSKNEMIVRLSLTTFIMSMLTNRMIIAEYMMKIVVNAMDADPGADENMKRILANVVTASATFGGLCFIHMTPCVVGVLSVVKGITMGPDFMNYAEYSFQAIPIELLTLLLNILYSILMAKKMTYNPISASSVKQQITEAKDELPPKPTLHEYATVFFTAVMIISLLFRWSLKLFKGINYGWSPADEDAIKLFLIPMPMILDATPVAAIVLIMHMLPSTLGWTRYFRPMTYGSLPVLKPENGMLFFKFVDKNTHYGYMLIMGATMALCKAVKLSGYERTLEFNKILSKMFMKQDWAVIIITAACSCFMTSMAVASMMTPFLVAINAEPTAFFVGLSAAYGLTSPFYYTPAYYFRTIAGFPLLAQIKTALPTVIIAVLVLLSYSFIGKKICWEACTAIKIAEEVSRVVPEEVAPTAATPPPAVLY